MFNKKNFVVSFNSQHELTDDEMRKVLTKIKNQRQNKDLNDKISNEEKKEEVHSENDT